MTNTKHTQLWKQICLGDADSISMLYHDYAKLLYVYGLKFTRKTELIEDVIQDLFLYIFRNHRRLDQGANVRAYLMNAFRNNLFRLLEREKRYFKPSDTNFDFDVTFSIERQIMASEDDMVRKKRLIKALKCLTSRQKEMIYLRFRNGLEYNEIATILSMEVESVRNAMCRSVGALRRFYRATSLVLLSVFRKKAVLT